MCTRRWPSVMGGMALVGMLAVALWLRVGIAAAQQPFTEWGWPTPYERVSTTSVDWLKAQGWWPLAIASQPPWPCANAITTVMIKQGLLQQRGIESMAQWFLAGPPIIESVAAGRTPVGFGGNFPATSMLDKQVPVRAIMLVTPNINHAVVVPNDSPYRALKDLKGTGAVIGIVTGSRQSSSWSVHSRPMEWSPARTSSCRICRSLNRPSSPGEWRRSSPGTSPPPS